MQSTNPQVRFCIRLVFQFSDSVFIVFRDQLYKHLEAVPPGDFEVVTSKLVQAGSTLEFLKYADALFDILIVGGLLQPGGQYLDEEGPSSPFSVFQAKEPPELDDIRKYVEVFNKLIRRYAITHEQSRPILHLLVPPFAYHICLVFFGLAVWQVQIPSEAVGDFGTPYSLAIREQMGSDSNDKVRHVHGPPHRPEPSQCILPLELDEGAPRQEWFVTSSISPNFCLLPHTVLTHLATSDLQTTPSSSLRRSSAPTSPRRPWSTCPPPSRKPTSKICLSSSRPTSGTTRVSKNSSARNRSRKSRSGGPRGRTRSSRRRSLRSCMICLITRIRRTTYVPFQYGLHGFGFRFLLVANRSRRRTNSVILVGQIVNAVKTTVEERPLAESEVIACLWQGLMSAVDWSARADQIEGLALREVTVGLLHSLHSTYERSFLTMV